VKRREFLALAAAPVLDTSRVAVRKTGKVEMVYKSPTPRPNGLQATKEGLWVIDQSAGSRASLVTWKEGKLLQGCETETDRPSGITFDGEALWIGSTYSREIVRCDARTGKAVKRNFTPGAGVIYKMAGDPPGRSSPVPEHMRQPAPPAESTRSQNKGQQVGGFQQGEQMGSRALGTGAHGQEWRDGKLWFCVPPSRMVYRMDPATWIVEKQFPVAGNRPHGIGWEGKYLWVTDSNLNAFHKHDPETGEIVEKIQLDDKDPLPHGMTIWQGMLWYCDDVGIICRLKM